MKIFVGFDDTDTIDADRGTGKLVRWFQWALPDKCHLWGVVRQQLLVDPAIPYTSHNSAACAVILCESPDLLNILIERAVAHIEHFSLPGSDPGLCVIPEGDPCLPDIVQFGLLCTNSVMTQNDACNAVHGAHLSGHGGTSDGIIGAAAAIGLTAYGWSGRLIEYNGLRDLPHKVSVNTLQASGIKVISLDRDAAVPAPDDIVDTSGWLRPRLLGGQAILGLMPNGPHSWESTGKKRDKKT
ncbi:MAG: hypothetical protein ACYDHW_16275 [Syntrophorhabdaceae bacterium]